MRVTPRAFDGLVDRALASIPERFGPYLENTVVVTEERPSREALARMAIGPGESLYGMYEGTPLTERGAQEPLAPDRIVIYRGPLVEDFGDDADRIAEQVRITVLHEIGHHFGLDEDALENFE